MLEKEKILNTNIVKRVSVFVIGLFIMALGVSLSVRAQLGVSPISCIPYVYSLKLPFTLGEITIIFNFLFILFQMIVLGKEYKFSQLIQLPVVIVFGYCIDITMYLLADLNPVNYLQKLVLCLVGCVVLAFGIFVLIKTRLTYLPLDGLVIAIIHRFKKEFGKVKITLDTSMVLIGTASSFILLGTLEGVREGSIIAALSVGAIIRFFSNNLPVLDKWLAPSIVETIEEKVQMQNTNKFVITISREYGSGGHEIGKLIAKELNIGFYDKDLIKLTAQNTGYTLDYIQENEQKLTNSLLYDLYEQNYAYVNDELPPKDVLFLVQSKIIRDICMKESCVIVGRCANFILKDHPNCINIFVHANDEYRKNKINKEYHVTPAVSNKELEESDKERANYCIHFTNKEWRDASNYHLTLDSSLYGSKQSAKKIIELIRENIK